jgi:rhodanese-related sulfurtransferase
MKKSIRTIFFKSISLIAFCSLFMACEAPPANEVDVMYQNIVENTRFVTSDWLAKKIINDDPSIQIIDVRSSYEFEEYSIPGSINIPLEAVLSDEYSSLFEGATVKTILYSNADIYADQAWVLLSSNKPSNLFVLEGGLNEWFKTIMLPQPPQVDAAEIEFETYSFRKGASLYFGGSVQDVPVAVEVDMGTKAVQKASPKKKVEVKKKVKKAAEGGC